jgi:hypothetical protein
VFLEGGSFPSSVLELQCRFAIKYFVHAVVASLIPQVTEDIGGFNKPIQQLDGRMLEETFEN